MVAMLRVVPNPFCALDGSGQPAGAYPVEGAPGSYLGARLEADGGDAPLGRLLAGDAIPAPRRFVFEPGTITVPATAHYLVGLRTGELLPADEECAREAGVPFQPPEEALQAAKDLAIARFQGTFGRPPAIAQSAPPAPKEGSS